MAAPVIGREAFEQRRRQNSARFGVMYLVLAAIVGIAVGGAVVLIQRAPDDQGPWSSFRPTRSGLAAAQQIGQYVASRYRLANGNPMTGALADEPSFTSNGQAYTVSAVLVKPGFADDTRSSLQLYPLKDAVTFTLMGAGTNGAIAGKGSAARLRILQREVLEIALYTFKYTSLKNVIALLPPTVNQNTGDTVPTAVFLRRADVAYALRRPLDRTLPDHRVVTPATRLTEAEQFAIDDARVLLYDYQPRGDGTIVMVVQPALKSQR